MGDINNFYDLDAWRKAHQLALDIYKITANFPKDELFGITSQIRRAATSISANISEGFNRYHFKDKTKFYHQARGSAGEVQNFLILAKDLNFINNQELKNFMERSGETKRLINGLINSIAKQD